MLTAQWVRLNRRASIGFLPAQCPFEGQRSKHSLELIYRGSAKREVSQSIAVMAETRSDPYLKEVDPNEDREDDFISFPADTSILLINSRSAQLFGMAMTWVEQLTSSSVSGMRWSPTRARPRSPCSFIWSCVPLAWCRPPASTSSSWSTDAFSGDGRGLLDLLATAIAVRD